MRDIKVGERIRLLMKENHLSQRLVEEQTGVNQSVLSEVINGRRDYEKTIEKLCAAYNWSRDFFVTGNGSPTQEIAKSDNSNNALSKEEKLRLISNLEQLYSKHQKLLDDASQVMKEIAAINKLLIVGSA